MTTPNFDFTRPDYGLRQRPDATAVGRKQPRLTTREAVKQTARGLAQAGMDLLQLGAAGAGDAIALGTGGALADILLSPTIESQRAEIDEFYGRPESGAGRGVNLFARLLGNVAVPLGPLKRAPGASRSAQRAVPVVRAASDAEVSRVVDALRRAPEGSKERRLLEDMMLEDLGSSRRSGGGTTISQEALDAEMARRAFEYEKSKLVGITESRRQPPVDIPIRDLEDLLNLRAFGSRRGPFSTSGKHAYDLGDLPPIADAREVAGVNRRAPRRFDITEQMRDPEFRSGKAAQQEIHAERLREERVNAELRDAIIEEGVPGFHQATGFGTRTPDVLDLIKPHRVEVQPRSLWQMLWFPHGTKQ